MDKRNFLGWNSKCFDMHSQFWETHISSCSSGGSLFGWHHLPVFSLFNYKLFYSVEIKTGVWEKWLCEAKPLQPAPVLLWGTQGMESREKPTDCIPGKGGVKLFGFQTTKVFIFFPHLFPRSTKHGRWEKSTFPASLIQAWHLETSLHSSCCTMIPTGGWFLNRLLSIFAFLPPPRLCSVRVHSSMRSAQSSRIIKSVQTPLQLLAFEERQLEVVFWFANSWMQQLI